MLLYHDACAILFYSNALSAFRFPDRFILDADSEPILISKENTKEDFFAGWDSKKAPINAVKHIAPLHVVAPGNLLITIATPPVEPSTLNEAQPLVEPEYIPEKETAPMPRRSSNTSAPVKPFAAKKGGLGAKKASKPINFEEAERLAKEEQEKKSMVRLYWLND